MSNIAIDKRKLVDVKSKISIAKQCELFGLPRSTYYYQPKDYSAFDLLIMDLIDKVHTEFPVYGYRKITVVINELLLKKHLPVVNEKRIRNYMKILGIEAIYQKPKLSKLGNAKYVFPYLLKNLAINTPNQVWSSDITYLPYDNGFMYLYAIIDWYSRAILAYDVNDNLEKTFVLKTIEKALTEYGKPKIMNSDQGSHFTSKDYIDLLQDNEIQISMDGKGRALDNIIIERFWRTIKYEYIFLHDFETPRILWTGVGNYFEYYNNFRPHQSLNYKKPMELYDNGLYHKNIKEGTLFNETYDEFSYFRDIDKTFLKYVI